MKRILFVLWRDVGSQVAVSRNMGESLWTKCRRFFWAMFYLGKALRVGVLSIGCEQLGSEVVYQGRRCFVSNWAGSESPTLSAPGFYQEYVPRAEIRNVFGLREAMHRFDVGFSWYTSSWYGIDITSRLYASRYYVPKGEGERQ